MIAILRPRAVIISASMPTKSGTMPESGGGGLGRRSFLLGAAAVVGGAPVLRGQRSSGNATPVASLPVPLRTPDLLTAFGEGTGGDIRLIRSGDRWQSGEVEVSTQLRPCLLYTSDAADEE